MRGSQAESAPFREPPSGGPRKAQPEVCPQSRSHQQSVGLRGKNLIFRLKVTHVRHASGGYQQLRGKVPEPRV
jgi:hypothetical protein